MTLLSKNNQLILIIAIVVLAIVLISALVFLILKRSNKNKYLTKVDAMLEEINVVNKSQLDAYILRLKNIANTLTT